MTPAERSRIFHTFLFPVFFLILIWIIKIGEVILEEDLATFGVYPREAKGLPGILLSPLIHGSFSHLTGNSVPIFILSLGLFYYYPKVSYRVFFSIYIAVGLWVWVAARQSYHIGASGVVYGLAAFHFLSGILRKHRGLMAFSLLVVFLYGSMVWGVLPIVESVSWESHLFGIIAGVISAYIFRKEGPQHQPHVWVEEEIPEEEYSDAEADNHDQDENVPPGINIRYEYVEKKKEE